MPNERFAVTVTRYTEVTVEIDTAKFGPEQIAEFRKHFYDIETLTEHAKHIAQYAVRFDSPDFLDGYGVVLYDGQKGYRHQEEEDCGINIIVGDEDVEIEVAR